MLRNARPLHEKNKEIASQGLWANVECREVHYSWMLINVSRTSSLEVTAPASIFLFNQDMQVLTF